MRVRAALENATRSADDDRTPGCSIAAHKIQEKTDFITNKILINIIIHYRPRHLLGAAPVFGRLREAGSSPICGSGSGNGRHVPGADAGRRPNP